MADVDKTIGTASRDYSTFTLHEAAIGSGAGGAGDNVNGFAYADSVFIEDITYNDTTPDTINIKAAAGEEHDGTAGTGVVIQGLVSVSTTKPFTFEILEIDGNGESDNRHYLVLAQNTTSVVSFINRMIIHGSEHNNIGSMFAGVLCNIGGHRITNNFVYDITNGTPGSGRLVAGIANAGSQDRETLNNTVFNTVVSNDGSAYSYSFNDDSDFTLTNNIGCDPDVQGTPTVEAVFQQSSPSNATVSYNLSSDATASGTGSLTNKSASNQFVSIVGGSEDLHLKSGADAIDAGTDLGTTPVGVNIDIDGRDRDAEGDTWDMGAHEFVSVGPAARPLPQRILSGPFAGPLGGPL